MIVDQDKYNAIFDLVKGAMRVAINGVTAKDFDSKSFGLEMGKQANEITRKILGEL